MKSFKNFLNEDTGFPTGPVGEKNNSTAFIIERGISFSGN